MSYRASLKNGQLVEDEKGPLIVTHNYVASVNNNDLTVTDRDHDNNDLTVSNDHDIIDLSKHDPNIPLDLSMTKVKTEVTSSILISPGMDDISDSGYITSPVSMESGLDLTVAKKTQDFSDTVNILNIKYIKIFCSHFRLVRA